MTSQFERGYMWPPITRTGDPITSYEAETVVNETGSRRSQCDNIYTVVLENPGRTAGEIAVTTGYGMHITSGRLADLKNRGLARQGQSRVWEGSGRRQVTWWAVVDPELGEFPI